MKIKYFIKRIIIEIFSKVFQKNIFLISTFLNLNKKKNRQIIEIGTKKLVIYKNYRYQLKIPTGDTGLKPLLHLKYKNLLNKVENQFLNDAIGQRTITKPIEEIISFGSSVCKKFKYLFYEETLDRIDIPPQVKLTVNENQKIINKFKVQNDAQINFLNDKIANSISVGSEILEIGYSTGGHSLISFEQMGFKVTGMDNFYDNNFEPPILEHIKISEKIKNNVNFIYGDISLENQNLNQKFDLIYSTSVIEHISDIKNALIQMHNLLKKDGVIFHNYNPFFSVYGGHALGNGDYPFMHLRLNLNDYMEYIKSYRPHEAELAVKWLKYSMNKKISQQRLKDLLEETGFKIIYFQSNNLNKFNFEVNKKILNECKENYSFLKLEDLLGHSVTFIASKI
ncbi:class I SAM-dependent methyltransferase [Candidatus Pelagibacter sp.]|nr:class I SAM-dependent methyltransferase [Candidatus Pelagibacter sp.]